MATVRVVLLADVDVGDGQSVQERLDAFREAILPSVNFGIVLFRGRREEVEAVLAGGSEGPFVAPLDLTGTPHDQKGGPRALE